MAMHKQRPRVFEQTKTDQSAKKDSDVNTVVNRYLTPRGPRIPNNPGAHVQPNWAEWSPPDFQLQLNRITAAKVAFQNLPSRIRQLFGNSPYQLVQWVNDPANVHQAINLGLIQPPEGYQEPVKPARSPQQMDLVVASLEKEIADLKAQRAQPSGESRPE